MATTSKNTEPSVSQVNVVRVVRNTTIERLVTFTVITALTMLLPFSVRTIQAQQTAPDTVKIGVLAKRSAERCLEKWGPTAEYLTDKIPGYSFTIVPLGFDEVSPTVEHGDVDFILVNPSFYVELEYLYGISHMATLKNLCLGKAYTVFGGVIFFRADRNDIKSLDNLRGKNFMAVEETSFGGWQMSWRELKKHGIDPYEDFADLSFGGTHDAVVYAVRNGIVDAGCVRTGLLEQMAFEGKISLENFSVISHDHTHKHACYYPFSHSTDTYPEWPFAEVKHIFDKLTEQVAVALLGMSPDDPAAEAARSAGWTIPHNYQPVNECLKYLRVGPYKDYGKVTFRDVTDQYGPWLLLATITVIIVVLGLLRVKYLNRKLRLTMASLGDREGMLSRITASVMDAVIMMDDQGNISFWNNAAEHIFGYSNSEAKGRNLHDLIAPKRYHEAHHKAMPHFLATGEGAAMGKTLELTAFRKDGTEFPVELSISPLQMNGQWHAVGLVRDIAERKEAEKALKENMKRNKALLQAMPDLIFVLSRDGTYIDVNVHDEAAISIPLDEIIGKNIRDAGFPDNALVSIMKRIKSTLNTGQSQMLNYELTVPQGRRHFEARMVRLTEDRILACVRDITEQKKIQDSLLRMKAAMEQSRDGIALTNLEGNIQFVNSAWADMHGWEEQKLEGKPLSVFHTEEQLKNDVKPFNQKLMVTGSREGEVGHVTRDGRTFPTWQSCSLMQDSNGQPVGIIAAAHDITGQKASEKALARALSQLQSVMDSSRQVAIIVTDTEGLITLLNAGAERMLGYVSKELVSKHTPEVFHLGSEIIDRGKELTEKLGHRVKGFEVLIANARTGIYEEREWTYVQKNGSHITVNLVVSAIYDENDQITGFLSVAMDITERKLSEDRLQQYAEDLRMAKEFQEENANQLQKVVQELSLAQAEAEAANEAKSNFLANMSHEIRTPMNGIIGMTSLTLDTNLTEEQREYLGMVKTSADNLLQIINDILDFSKIEAGRMDLELIDFSLRETIESAIGPLTLRTEEKGVELILYVDPLVPDSLIGDPTRLQQVIINLVGNSVKFTEEGNITLRVELETLNGKPTFHFSVSDTGIGIPEDKLYKIFESFTQVDGSTTRKYGGTGLGTTISRQIVELMGGKIWIESPTNESGTGSPGTTVHFVVGLSVQETQKPAVSFEPTDLSGKRVLVIDDNLTNRRYFSALLENWDLKATTASNGQEALDKMATASTEGHPFDLTLLDVIMPQLDGFQVIEQLATEDRLDETPIIMLCSAHRRGDSIRAREMGAAAYLTKPVRETALYEAIVNALSKKKDGHTDNDAADGPAERPATATVDTCNGQILLAEDNKVNQMLAVRLLQKRNYEVTAVGNGQLAVDAVKSAEFDAILMDVQMPVLGGFEATLAIRDWEHETGHARLPIIAMTANAMDGDREKCLDNDMDDYISKPISPAKLYACLKKYVQCEESRKQTTKV
ncbi:MAG: hypothetical protein DRP45_01870 [Candidatus Zixiibacteriota bacterium]|nr:MAG: hypothetical protein DRP45_01870 [candidate division Zixibacteria bacterium]